MDLIPKPRNPLPGIDIPLLNVIPYDHEGFDTFPSRNGIFPDTGIIASLAPDHIASVLQSWLYFALIAEFFETPIDIQKFTCMPSEPDGNNSVCSKPLNYLMQSRPTNVEKKRRLLTSVYQALRKFEYSFRSSLAESPLGEVTLSVRILLHALGEYIGMSMPSPALHPLIERRLMLNQWCPSQIKQIGELYPDGTAYYVSLLPRTGPANLRHDSCPYTHCTARNVEGSLCTRHTDECTMVCEVDTNSSTSHPAPNIARFDENRPCPLLSVDSTTIRSIIREGNIPLVRIETLLSGEVGLRVREARAQDCFIAISHVWSDGLGNPFSNALPKCQIERLSSYMRNLPHPSSKPLDGGFRSVFSFGSVSVDLARASLVFRKKSRSTWFWMDTLCIPVGDDEETADLKSRAIDQMALIYGRASQVLVLDRSIQQMTLNGAWKSEILARMNHCGWKGRCWTYQEGSLSPFCYFQCADGALNPLVSFPYTLGDNSGTSDVLVETELPTLERTCEILFKVLPRGISALHHFTRNHRLPHRACQHYLSRMIYRSLYSVFKSSMHISGQPQSVPPRGSNLREDTTRWIQQLVGVWNALSRRSTTKADDVPAIFANLLGFHSYQIMKIPPDERLRTMLWNEDVLPVSLLYNTGPRLHADKNHRNRWVPTSLSRDTLQALPLMSFDNDMNLALDGQRMFASDLLHIVLITSLIPSNTPKFLLKNRKEGWWLIEFWRVTDDELNIEGSHGVCLIMERNSTRGACLRSIRVDREESMPDIVAIYDCPISATFLDERPPGWPDCDCKWLADASWKITLLNDTVGWTGHVPRISRAHTQAAPGPRESITWAFKHFSIMAPLIPLVLIPTILRIYIAIQLGWKDLAPVGRVSLITFIIQRIPSPLVFLPLTQILFLQDRREQHTVTRLDIAYTVLDCVWIVYSIAMFPVLVYHWIRYRFEFQLAMWREDGWEEKNIETWWLETRSKLPRIVVRLVERVARYKGRDRA